MDRSRHGAPVVGAAASRRWAARPCVQRRPPDQSLPLPARGRRHGGGCRRHSGAASHRADAAARDRRRSERPAGRVGQVGRCHRHRERPPGESGRQPSRCCERWPPPAPAGGSTARAGGALPPSYLPGRPSGPGCHRRRPAIPSCAPPDRRGSRGRPVTIWRHRGKELRWKPVSS